MKPISPTRVRRAVAFATCLLMIAPAYAQLADLDPDWKELETKPPATFRTDKLVPIEMPRYLTVKLGLDPDSLTVSSDGIVRYVVVAVSGSGNINAAYEGIWCRAGEVKTYAPATTANGTRYPIRSGRRSMPASRRCMHWRWHAKVSATGGRHPAYRRKTCCASSSSRCPTACSAEPSRRPGCAAGQRVMTRLSRWTISGSAT